MIDIKLNKDIREYKSQNGLSMTLRQTIIISVGITLAVLAAVRWHDYVPIPILVPLIVAPFGLVSDIGPKIQGMQLREFVWLWFRFLFLEKKQLKFVGNNLMRKMTDQMNTEADHQEKGSETDESKIVCETEKRALPHTEVCAGNHSGAKAMARRHFSKRKHLQ